MKKHFYVLILIIIIILGVYFGTNSRSKVSVTGFIEVLEKTNVNDKLQLTVFNPMEKNGEPFLLRIDDENAWNLIEYNRMYFVSYEYKDREDDIGIIDKITHPEK